MSSLALFFDKNFKNYNDIEPAGVITVCREHSAAKEKNRSARGAGDCRETPNTRTDSMRDM
jgi:hypothetical protein